MTYKPEDLRWNDPEIEADVAALWDGDPSPDDQNFYRIGGLDEVRALMADLQALRARMDPPAFSEIWKEVADDATVDSLERDLCQCVTCIDKAQLINRIRREQRDKRIVTATIANFSARDGFPSELFGEAVEALRSIRATVTGSGPGDVILEAGEQIRAGDAIVMRNGKAYRI